MYSEYDSDRLQFCSFITIAVATPEYWSDKNNNSTENSGVDGGEINENRKESAGREVRSERERGNKLESSGDTDSGQTEGHTEEESYQDDYNPNDNDINQNNLPLSVSQPTDSTFSKNVPQAPSDLGRRSDHRASKYSLSR